MPYPTGRFFRGTLSQALRARLRSVLSLRDVLADISQQHLATVADLGRNEKAAESRAVAAGLLNSVKSAQDMVRWNGKTLSVEKK